MCITKRVPTGKRRAKTGRRERIWRLAPPTMADFVSAPIMLSLNDACYLAPITKPSSVLMEKPWPNVSASTRKTMRANRSVDTKPELIVRRLLYQLGYRYRLHRKDLPGTPDIVFGARRKIIFVNGCFWHGHCCKDDTLPKTRATYWEGKFARNRARDELVLHHLTQTGWQVLVIWECEIKEREILSHRLEEFLGQASIPTSITI